MNGQIFMMAKVGNGKKNNKSNKHLNRINKQQHMS